MHKKSAKDLQDSNICPTFAPQLRGRPSISNEDGPFVYRLVLKIFILARGVRFPHGLRKRAYQFW